MNGLNPFLNGLINVTCEQSFTECAAKICLSVNCLYPDISGILIQKGTSLANPMGRITNYKAIYLHEITVYLYRVISMREFTTYTY